MMMPNVTSGGEQVLGQGAQQQQQQQAPVKEKKPRAPRKPKDPNAPPAKPRKPRKKKGEDDDASPMPPGQQGHFSGQGQTPGQAGMHQSSQFNTMQHSQQQSTMHQPWMNQSNMTAAGNPGTAENMQWNSQQQAFMHSGGPPPHGQPTQQPAQNSFYQP